MLHHSLYIIWTILFLKTYTSYMQSSMCFETSNHFLITLMYFLVNSHINNQSTSYQVSGVGFNHHVVVFAVWLFRTANLFHEVSLVRSTFDWTSWFTKVWTDFTRYFRAGIIGWAQSTRHGTYWYPLKSVVGNILYTIPKSWALYWDPL
jgi:hypothetical protein